VVKTERVRLQGAYCHLDHGGVLSCR